MEKKQRELCLEILRRFNKAGILKDIILIGSWSAYFYNEYFSGTSYLDRAALKTRDIDFYRIHAELFLKARERALKRIQKESNYLPASDFR